MNTWGWVELKRGSWGVESYFQPGSPLKQKNKQAGESLKDEKALKSLPGDTSIRVEAGVPVK